MSERRPAWLDARYDLSAKRVWVAGHRGMVGSALVRRLASESCEIITADRATVDLTRQEAVGRWMAEVRPQAIFLAAAKVGGILANSSSPATFLYENLMRESSCAASLDQRTGARLGPTLLSWLVGSDDGRCLVCSVLVLRPCIVPK